MTDLGTLGGITCYVHAINRSGAIVGESDLPSGRTHAFVYANGAVRDLGSLAARGGGDFFSEANGINDHGEIAVTRS